jgi:hypothetical protein
MVTEKAMISFPPAFVGEFQASQKGNTKYPEINSDPLSTFCGEFHTPAAEHGATLSSALHLSVLRI